MFQSTHPCGVRRAQDRADYLTEEVSIHAPLRGATLALAFGYFSSRVSIHAPLRGATFFLIVL